MATRVRRPYPPSAAVALYAEIAPDARAALDELAAELQAPKWAVLDALLRHAREARDADGRPTWWSGLPRLDQEELPLKSA